MDDVVVKDRKLAVERKPSTTSPAMPYLPSEILQSIFGHLDFKSSIRCQRVCKLWREFLPGWDPVLLEKLFLRAGFVDEATQKRIDEENGRRFTPLILVPLRAPFKVIALGDQLPYLAYNIEVLDGDLKKYGPYRRLADFNEHTDFHPIIKNPARYMDLVNPNFKSLQNANAYLNFKTIEELVNQTCMPKDYDYKDGSWRDMFICQPAVRAVDVFLCWPQTNTGRVYEIRKEEGNGVTVGDFVEILREKLSDAKADILEISEEITETTFNGCYEEELFLDDFTGRING